MPPFSEYHITCMYKPIKTVVTASALAICVILCLTLSFFSSFAHQTARESVEIAHPRGISRSVMVITCKCHYPMHEPPPLFCPMLACTKVRCNCGILQYMFAYYKHVIFFTWARARQVLKIYWSTLEVCVAKTTKRSQDWWKAKRTVLDAKTIDCSFKFKWDRLNAEDLLNENEWER